MFTWKGHSVFTKHGIEELPEGYFLKGYFQVYGIGGREVFWESVKGCCIAD